MSYSDEDVERYRLLMKIFNSAVGDPRSRVIKIIDMIENGNEPGGVFDHEILQGPSDHMRTKVGRDELIYTLKGREQYLADWIRSSSAALAVCRPGYVNENMFLNSFNNYPVPASGIPALIPIRQDAVEIMKL